MINFVKFDLIIKNGDLEKFKNEFSSCPINAHHRLLLLEKTIMSNHKSLMDFMMTKAQPNPEVMVKFFLQSLEKTIPQENIVIFNEVRDPLLMEKMDRLHIEYLIKNQSEKTYEWFLEKFPITAFKNFQSIYICSFKHDKEHYTTPFLSTQFHYKTCYNFALCAFEHDKVDILEKFLVYQVQKNPQALVKMKEHQKELYDDYIFQKKRMAQMMAIYKQKFPSASINTKPTQYDKKAEELNEFVNEHIGKAFHNYLEQQLNEKPGMQKKTKI